MDKTDVIQKILWILMGFNSGENKDTACALLSSEYPFNEEQQQRINDAKTKFEEHITVSQYSHKAPYDEYQGSKFGHLGQRYQHETDIGIAYRDGFIDRYNGEKLVYPGALRVIHLLLPDDVFPDNSGWKEDRTHIAYWELLPTLDLVVPRIKYGMDRPENLIVTSKLNNLTKSNWTLKQLGWNNELNFEPYPANKINNWDGLMESTRIVTNIHREQIGEDPLLKGWSIVIKEAKKYYNDSS